MPSAGVVATPGGPAGVTHATVSGFLYRFSGALAALGMVGTLLMVSAGIFSRLLGIYLRGTDDYAGYRAWRRAVFWRSPTPSSMASTSA